MINLLTTNEQRKLHFIEILASSYDTFTLPSIAERLDCSVRVLQDDIDFFEENFDDFEIHTSNKGVQLTFERGKNLESVYQRMLRDSNTYRLLELVFLYEGKSTQEIADLLNVSISTIYRLINIINAKTAEYDFKILTNPCRVAGNEENIRFYYYQYFDERYSYLDYEYNTMDESAIDDFLRFFIDFTQIPVDFAFYNIFKLVASINLKRYKNNHYVDTSDIAINFDEIIPNLDVFENIFKDFEDKLDVKVSADLINQMFAPYVQKGFSLNFERLMAKAEQDKELAQNIDYLEQALTRIAEKNNLPLYNKKDIILALNNASHLEFQEPQAGYVLYNKNQHFVDEVQESFPYFYEVVFSEMEKYREILQKPDIEDGVNYYIYTLFLSWDNLVPELLKKFKQVHVTVISDRHITFAYLIKDFIEYEFSEQIVVDIYEGIKLDESSLDNLNSDLILTTFPLPFETDQEIVYIENTPTLNDLTKLQKAINTLIPERLNQVSKKAAPPISK